MVGGGTIIGKKKPRDSETLLTPEMMDEGTRRRVVQFLQTMEAAIMEANCEVIGKQLPHLDEKTFLKVAVRVAELRADYVALGLHVAEQRHPDPAAIKQLAQARVAYEEMAAVFDAAERVVKRGYVKLG
ncbi:hypothetical protein M2352_002676 [Azospirillum fermentarium]|uniref:hypothetical protein n=1 Tax=Azospirillum fermentarium TaxID=1233114 RepID=UPI0022270A17|nr:hypothetical protein [Azospirillum fermentarium]MCW2247085.1 hypothetical protein [Azospirillum fermentarium]